MAGSCVPATLDGFDAVLTRHGFAALGGENAAGVSGVVTPVGADELARLDYFAGATGASRREMSVRLDDGTMMHALCYTSDDGADGAWNFEQWEANWAPAVRSAVAVIMAGFGNRPSSDMRRSLPQIMVRAASWARAQREVTPAHVRTPYGSADVESLSNNRPYLDFFTLEEQDLRFRRFDGNFSDVVKRAAFVSGDAVTVLPYDPVRDRVLVIEQFRFGPLVRGDRRPWSIEPIAGRVDPGESPEDCARREAVEETGLALQDLIPIGNYYPSPGAVSEYLFSFLAMADLPDDVTGIGGLDDEAEDIRSILLSFDALMDMLTTGEAQNGPLILSALWLKSERDRLRASA